MDTIVLGHVAETRNGRHSSSTCRRWCRKVQNNLAITARTAEYTAMIHRSAMAALQSSLRSFPVVALLGPRQVGKTTLALTLAEDAPGEVTYLDLESPSHRARLADPEAYLESQSGHLVILDEVHRVPELFSVLRGIVDLRRRAGARAGHFLVLGSASVELLRQSSESLAGRIAFVELTPVGISEVDADVGSVNRLWVRGGLPDSLLADDDGLSLAWREAFVRTYLERDVPQFGPRVPAETLRRFWTMLAHEQGQQLNASRLAASLGISGRTVGRYLDLMVDLLLARRLQAWSGNAGKRLVRSPKVYLRDSGLVHALLGLETLEDVLGHPVAGGSWEGLIVENLCAVAGTAAASYYRTSAGAEIDLILEGRGSRRYAIEIKRSSAPKMSRGFGNAIADLDVDEAILVYPGKETFPVRERVLAMGPHEAVRWVRERLTGQGRPHQSSGRDVMV